MYTNYSHLEIRNFHSRYLIELIFYQLLTLVQITLIISTVYKFYIKRYTESDDKQHHINHHIKWQFISVLSLGSLIFLLVEWNGIADVLHSFATIPYYCDIAAILGNIILITYLLALYLFYLYRLWATFKNSALQMSNKTIRTLFIITLSVYFIILLLVLTFQRAEPKHTLFSQKHIVICDGEFSIAIHSAIRIALQCIVIIANTFYGWVFARKLYNLLNLTDCATTNNRIQRNVDKAINSTKRLQSVYRLMNKQTTLVTVSTVSTSVFWSIANISYYFGSFLQIFIYIDITVNCLCMFLMFSWNDKLYVKLCTPFDALTHMCCAKLFGSNTKYEIEEINTQKTNVAVHLHPYQEPQQFKKEEVPITD